MTTQDINPILKQNINENQQVFAKEKYDEILNSNKQYALVLLNIKNFRYFNAKYDVSFGDQILKMLQETMSELLFKDEYVAHLYSDNFVLFLTYDNTHDLLYVRMMEFIQKTYRIKNDKIYRNLFLSMGIYLINDKSVEFSAAVNFANLCRKACDTLFNRSHCMEIYDQTFYDKYIDYLDLEVKTAQAYLNYEFMVHLQPKVDLKTEKIVGAEALLRWFDKDGKMIPLNEFLPILNKNGYIDPIDLDSFEQVCEYLDNRIKNNKKIVPISVNISKSYFYKPNILKDYITVFEKYNIPKDYIEIEFMESISMDNTDRMKSVINDFREYGFKCELDDFGNGYSSFNVLLNAKLDAVKMDRQFFVNNLNGDSRLVIKTVVDLIHSLNMRVVAEGVEEKEHIDWLKECGCETVQGYYYYKPMPIAEIDKLLDNQ